LHLSSLIDRFGEVGDVYIPRDHYTQDSRGFAFVRFHDKRDAEEAAEKMQGFNFHGRELRVQFAQRRRVRHLLNQLARSKDAALRRMSLRTSNTASSKISLSLSLSIHRFIESPLRPSAQRISHQNGVVVHI
jgi:RNA recognition motif-containing protein